MTDPERPDLMLAMDTSGDVCSVAALRNGQFVTEHTFRHGMRLSERLFGHIEGVLREANAVLDDVTAFAVGLGPGSFTGTRIGVMTLKTLAVVQNKPLYGINSLEALAMEYQGIEGVTLVPVLPCRTNVVLAAAYRVKGELPETQIEAATFALAEPGGTAASVRCEKFCFLRPCRRPLWRGTARTVVRFGAKGFHRRGDVSSRRSGGAAGSSAAGRR